ncbi:hypothetical protein Mp_6g10280 [Marchantia polymorpha subsp. ruderalis]|uniref:Uncharacterized protein n=2 Tax=Marchantia polymorpha TaxID=3197 RepID=A0AAF6BQI9_MARPO|nr:hypothetical protein MARPO_0016s0071 [Marchantia polymorpha]BBN14273.1 hypothetical protein Mp_6g10280 [Marchantia polymorpha subsp. ruderalis]|eukprot:PTQ45008.1 hypothetical protein MARPO_0016s0071 [Marchantia polymorpha]
MVSVREAIFGSAKKRSSTISSSSIKEGEVQNGVERNLKDDWNLSPDDVQAIMSSTRVKNLHYCQSALTSFRSSQSETECQSARPGRDKHINHDFAVFDLTATKFDGQHFNFFISAEKEGGGQEGGDSGIYIKVLTPEECKQLEDNILKSWEGFSTLVPLDILTRRLSEYDKHYNLVYNNCWDYATAACKIILLLLSKQPDVNHENKQYFIDNAEKVEKSVLEEFYFQLSLGASRNCREDTAWSSMWSILRSYMWSILCIFRYSHRRKFKLQIYVILIFMFHD